MSLKGKVALITGSTSGIGRGIARALAAAGADVMLNGFGDAVQIEALRAGMAAEYSVKVAYSGSDISKPEQIAAMVAETEATLGSLDILVNNAGIQSIANIEDFPAERWDAIIAINLSGVFHAMKAAIPGMKRRGWGRIVNIASAHGLVASPQKLANAICPGWVLTPLVQKQLEDKAKQEGTTVEDQKHRFLIEKQAMAEFSTPEQIGALAVFLCSEGARTITGAPLSIDGGWVAQ